MERCEWTRRTGKSLLSKQIGHQLSAAARAARLLKVFSRSFPTTDTGLAETRESELVAKERADHTQSMAAVVDEAEAAMAEATIDDTNEVSGDILARCGWLGATRRPTALMAMLCELQN